MREKSNRLIVVLGMHRSGTSAITRALMVLGVELGERMMPPLEGNNNKGFWEDLDLNALNIEMLNFLGSNWHHLAPIEPIDVEILRKEGFFLRAVEMLRQKSSGVPIFGYKDPRVSKLLPFWKEVFEHCQFDLSYVIALRNPLSVVKSLANRDGLETGKSYLLWLEHVISSLIGSSDGKRILVDYDHLMRLPDHEIHRIAEHLNLRIDQAELKHYKTGFLDQELRHTLYELDDLLLDDACPPVVRESYAALLDVASDKSSLDDPDLQSKVSHWSNEFYRLRSPLLLIDKLCAQTELAAHAAADQNKQIAALNQSIAERDAQAAALNQSIAERDAQAAALNQSIAERDAQAAALNQSIAESNEQIANLVNTVDRIYHSSSWRLLTPLRILGRQLRRLGSLIRALPPASARKGGYIPMLRFAFKVWRLEGCQGVKSLARQETDNDRNTSSSAPEPQILFHGLQIDAKYDNQKPEILFVSHDASRTGAPVFLLELARMLKNRLEISCVFLLRSGGHLEEAFQTLGPTLSLANSNEVDPLTLHALKKRNIRLVYSNTATNGLVQQRLKELGCPILCHVHELGFSIEQYFGGNNLKAVLSATDFFLAGSGAVASYLTGQQHISPEKITIAPPFIDVEANRLCAEQNVSLPDLPPGTIVVGACGTIGWRKGTDLFVQVARRVLETTSHKIHFVWLGGPISHGEYHSVYHDAVMTGIDSHMTFPGAVSPHLPYFNQFDIFMLPSREDPFPLVVLDAASLGIPVLCFADAGGAPELVEGDAGIVVPYLDVEDMATAVARLVEDSELRHKLGGAAYAKVLARHDINVGGGHIAAIVANHMNLSTKENN